MLGELLAAFPDRAASVCLVGAAAAVAGMGSVKRNKGKGRKWFQARLFLVLAGAGVCLGMGFFSYKKVPERTPAEEAAQEETQAVAQGRVSRVLPQKTGYRVLLEECRIFLRGQEYREEKIAVDFSERPSCGPGQWAEAAGRASAAEPARNPGEFDFREYYRAQGIRVFLDDAALIRIRGEKNLVLDGLERFREKAAELLCRMAGEKNGGILAAVLLGDKSRLDGETRDLYQDSGISHLLAVSGLHVSMAGMGIWLAARKLGAGFWTAAFCGILIIFGYCFLTGASVSSRRASCMYLFLLLSRCLGRSYDGLSAAGIAGIWILLEEPLQLFQGGFQLSFGAVLSVCALYGPLKEWCLPEKRRFPAAFRKLAEGLLLSAAIQIGTLPILCWHFYVWPPYGILLNLWVIPLLPAVFLTGALGCGAGFFCFPAGQFFTGAAGAVLWLYEQSCRISLELPGAEQILGRPSPEKVLVYYAGILAFLGWRKGRKGREAFRKQKSPSGMAGAGVLLLAGFLLLLFKGPEPVRLDVLDVGQGDGMVLSVGEGRQILIDGGSTSEKQIGTECILPYLQSRGIRELDCAFVSHADADHTNGLKELMEAGYPIGRLFLPAIGGPGERYRELEEAAGKAGIPVTYLTAGARFRIGGTTVRCLHPPSGFSWKEENSYFLVLKVEAEGLKLLLTGDLDEQGEEALLASGEDLSCQVLKVAHHGSRTSTSEAFLERASPMTALISAGRGNSYGHPHEETLKRLEERGAEVRRTDREGMLRVEGNKVSGFLEACGEGS